MLKVIDGKVRYNGKTYEEGDNITGLSEKDKARLISLKVAEYVITIDQTIKNSKLVDKLNQNSKNSSIKKIENQVNESQVNENEVNENEVNENEVNENEINEDEVNSIESLNINFNAEECIVPVKKARK